MTENSGFSSQIFKAPVPNEILWTFLNKVATRTEKTLVFNLGSYKKAVFGQHIEDFLQSCFPYYYTSKRKYIEGDMTYNRFITVLRQICNANHIAYSSQAKYFKSTYNVEYTFHRVPASEPATTA